MSMLNMKKTHGRKGNKQGIILVMILFIFAISLILIVCALMLTTGTRGRLYRRAEDSQARLTVTAAAESFLQALYMGEITDANLNTLADAGVTLRLNGGSIPGMSDSDPDNMTELTIKRAISGDSSSDVVLEFTTTIDTMQENVQVVLQYNPTPTPPPDPGSHVAMIETSGGADLHELQVGTGDGSDSADNIVFCRGDIDFGRGGTAVMGSIYVSYNGNFHMGDNISGGRVALYGENGNVTGMGGSTNINGAAHLDNLLFINPNATSASNTWNVGNVGGLNITNETYVNRGQGGRPGLSNTPTTTDPLVSIITSKVNTILAQDNFSFTAPADAPQWVAADSSVHYTNDDGTPGAALTRLPQPTSNGQTIPAGNYYMTGVYGGNNTVKHCVLSSGTTVYVAGTTQISGLVFWCNGDVKFVLLDGASFNINQSGGNLSGFGSYGNRVGGIISTPGRTETEANSNSIGWPSDTGSDIPQCSIIGYGNNHLDLDDACVLDSFISLFHGGEFEMTDASSHYYGRIIADSADFGNTGSAKVFPYCPSDSSDPIDDGHFHAHYSDFDIVSFWYYY